MERHLKKEEEDDESLHLVDVEAKRFTKEQGKQVPDAIECSFANSSEGSSGGFLSVSDNEYDDEEEEESDWSSSGSSESDECVDWTCDTIGNGHCSWAEGSASQLVTHVDNNAPDGKHNNKTKTRKCVRFAMNPDGSVKSPTRLLSLISKDCWWNRKDAMRIHAECHAVATHYKKHCPQYKDALAGLSFSTNEDMSEQEIAQYQEDIAHEAARGLEGYISELKDILRKTHEGLVLLAQDEQREQGMHLENDSLEAIRKVSRKTSQPARQLALKLAEYDTFEALKAMFLPWNPDDEDDICDENENVTSKKQPAS